MIELTPPPVKALLVPVRDQGTSAAELTQDAEELDGLARAAGWEVAGSYQANLRGPNASLLLGSGTVDEVVRRAEELDAALILIDHPLSPSQQRNWEEQSGLSVTDRQGLILEIFAKRAQTKEAQLQVELARLQYVLPRLASSYAHLSRQRGGSAGSRGQGETQIELDRRLIQDRIVKLKAALDQVRKQRDVQRKQRQTQRLPTVALVGYTNAGKSSLHRSLSGNDTLVMDALFATLDPTARQCALPSGQSYVLVDTVGFVRKLPHGLVEAFKATLEESALADLILHVVDASNPHAIQQFRASQEVLAEIGAQARPQLVVLNKIDAADQLEVLQNQLIQQGFPVVAVSALTGQGLSELQDQMTDLLSAGSTLGSLTLPYAEGRILAWLHEQGCVVEEEARDEGHQLKLRLSSEQRVRLERAGFAISGV